MKDKLLYIDICILKVVAILIVVIGSYYRFFDVRSPLSFVVLLTIVALLFNAVYSLAQRIIKRSILHKC